MKVLLNVVAAAFIASGLVVAATSLMAPGRVILGIDVRLAATLLIGGFALLGLARALALLERISGDVSQLQQYEAEPPWLREPAAAMSPDVAEPEFGTTVADEPATTDEAQWPEPEHQPAAERELEAAPEPETQAAWTPEPEFEPAEAATPKDAQTPAEAEPSELEPSQDAVEEQAAAAAVDRRKRRAIRKAERAEAARALSEPAEAAPPQDFAAEEPELYVVEERMFRDKQARVLSDGTIEAETDQGWMRFEDLGHLEEYLDATAQLHR